MESEDMKWHYLKNNDYPKCYSKVIVKCEDGEVLKTGYSHYDGDKNSNHKSFAESFYYDDDCFDANIGALTFNNVIAWRYIDDAYE